MNPVPKALKNWFVVHFVFDMVFAIPLFLFPEEFLGLLGWHSIDPFTARIVAAALFGIGIESFLARNAEAETYKNMLNLKLIWSMSAIIGIGLSIYQSPYESIFAEWFFLMVFAVFNILWLVWRMRIGREITNV